MNTWCNRGFICSVAPYKIDLSVAPFVRLGLISSIRSSNGWVTPAISWPRYEEVRDGARSFGSVAISAFDNFTLTGRGDPEQLNGLRVSASFFPTLGLLPAIGRNFTQDPERKAKRILEPGLKKLREGTGR